MSHDTLTDINGVPVCQCGAFCWKFDDHDVNQPCWGEIGVSEDYPGMYTHFCSGHQHYEDNAEYIKPAEPAP